MSFTWLVSLTIVRHDVWLLANGGWMKTTTKKLVLTHGDFFQFTDGGDDKRQYTMCHEVSCCSRGKAATLMCISPYLFSFPPQIGHGFGLPHTDENFNNKNTGECMDYTRNAAQNKQPGPENFAFLQLSEFYICDPATGVVSQKLTLF